MLTSRTRLQQMIKELNLYERERRTSRIDEVVRQARRDVTIAMSEEPGSDAQTFAVRFVASDRAWHSAGPHALQV